MTLTNQQLVYILTTDPILGTTADAPDTPTGAYNRELAKLIANDLELEASLNAVSERTYGADSGEDAPDPLPVSPVNAPSSPSDGALHITYYDDFEVVVQWDGSAWNEVFRVARVGGGTVYAEVNTGSGASVGTVSGTTLAGLANSATSLSILAGFNTLTGNLTMTAGTDENRIFELDGFSVTVVDAGYVAGDRLGVIGDGTIDLNGSAEVLVAGEYRLYEHTGSEWGLVSKGTDPSTVTSGTGSTEGIVSADTIETIAAGVTATVRKREVVDVDGDGFAGFSLPRTVGGVSMSAEHIVGVVGVQDATVDKASFTSDVKDLEVRVAADGSNFAVYWDGAAADDQVAITYLK